MSYKTWTLTTLHPGYKAISCKWVFKLKDYIDGRPPLKKARLIAQGFQQQEGIDFTKTFAPVIKWATICTVVALATAQQWTVHHMDVRTAFLHASSKKLST
jgi:hypothetical protein